MISFSSNFNKVLSRFICIEQPDCKLFIHHSVYADCFETHLLPPVFLILVPRLLKFGHYWVSWIEIYDGLITNWFIRVFGSTYASKNWSEPQIRFPNHRGNPLQSWVVREQFQDKYTWGLSSIVLPLNCIYGDRKTEWLVTNDMKIKKQHADKKIVPVFFLTCKQEHLPGRTKTPLLEVPASVVVGPCTFFIISFWFNFLIIFS